MEEKRIRLDEINFHALAALLLKHLWAIGLLCISAVLCVSSISRLTYTPQYTSTATFMVSAKDGTNAYNSLTTTQSMAAVFVEVFQSNVLREKVQEQMPGGEFDGTINTNTIPQTNLLIVTVTSPEPDTSFHALELIIENYSSISDYLFANAQLEVIKDPVIPVLPSNMLNMDEQHKVVAVLAAIAGAGIVIAIYLFRKTVKTAKAASRKLDARLLRTINHEEKNKTFRSKFQRKNIAPLITNPLISKGFIEDNLSLSSALTYHMRKRSQKVIMVTSVGENEGKSTVAANLALALAQKNKKVVLLDCDFRKPSIHKIFELPVSAEQSLSHALLHDAQDLSVGLTEAKKYGISLGISQPSGKRITQLLNNGKLRQLIAQLREQADYIILDTPPMLAVADAEVIATMVDTSLLVARADFMSVDAINNGMDRLRQSAPDFCGFVLNNYRTTVF